MSRHTNTVIAELMQEPAFAAASEEKNWLPYRLTPRPDKKPLKIPVIDGSNASYKDAGAMTLTEALEADADGVGYVPRAGSALVGIDFDNCVEDQEIVEPSVMELVEENVYSEFSPSGKGIRMLLPRELGEDQWSKELDDIGFFGADNKWFTVTFDSYWGEPEFGDSAAVRTAVEHLKVDQKAATSASAALRGAGKDEQPRWWLTMPYEWQERALIDALSALDPRKSNGRDEWVRISASLHSTGYPWVKELWHQWSEAIAEDTGDNNYDRSDNDVTWASFTIKPNGRTLGSLFFDAREAGWDQDKIRQDYQDHINPPVSDLEFIEIDLDELKATELPDIDFIVDDVFPSQNLIGLAGPSGAGKTRFTAALVASMASGNTDVIGLPKANRAVRTLYCANEERAEDLKRRIKAAAMLNDLPADMKLVVRGKDGGTLKLATKDGEVNKPVVDFLIDKANEEAIELIIFDPFVTLGASEESAAEGVAPVIEAMQQITQESGAAVMFIHHTPKGDRSAPPDEMRGSDAAFRGSGAIYSSLDVGLTLFPYLPPSAHHPKDGRSYRRALLSAQRSKSVPKYIVLDPAKNREGEAISPVIYELSAHEVRVGGKPIGAIKVVDQKEADWTCDRAVDLGSGSRDVVLSVEAGRVLAEKWGVGNHKTTLTEVHDYLAENLSVWEEDTGKIRADRGTGAKLLDLFRAPIQSGTVSVLLEHEGKITWLRIV